MPFDTMSARLQEVATRTLAHCKGRYGANGLRIEEGIDPRISWRPSFFLRVGKLRIIAVEVEDNLYPEVLKGAAHDISHFDSPIAVFQACSLEAYQTDPKHAKVALLRSHGFGILTVDDAGGVTTQNPGIPLLQFIASGQFESEISKLTPALKVALRASYDTYVTNEGQGLQQAGQVVEGLVGSIAEQASKKAIIPPGAPKKALADLIDELYQTAQFKPHRAALGGARDFIKEFRNTASHAPKTAKQAADKIRKCKLGFLDAIGVSRKLRDVAKAVGFKTHLHM